MSEEVADPGAAAVVAVYGGREDEVGQMYRRHLEVSQDDSVYQTWVNLSLMRRLVFLFRGGVESTGGLVEILCMFAVVGLVLALFALYQLVVFFAVILVLTVFSGGAAVKYVRGTFLVTQAGRLDDDGLEALSQECLKAGHFISVRVPRDRVLPPLTRRADRATFLFRTGVNQALAVATLFLVVEAVARLLTGQWLLDLGVLLIFAAGFASSVVVMDAGVVARWRLAQKVQFRDHGV